jgi:lipoprotein-releasing system permease protein
LAGQALINFAGKDTAITLSGMIPEKIRDVSTIENYMLEGSVDNLMSNPSGIIIGKGLAKKLSLGINNSLTVTAPNGQVRTFKVLGIFRTGRATYDESQSFADLKRVQALMGKVNRANTLIIKLPDPYQARDVAASIERDIGYKAMSWQEASEDLMSTLAIRNLITYTIVSAVLVVAGFGIYNVISTVVMEKHRDIAILKSMGFHAADILKIFVTQGVLLGLAGCMMGVPLGCALMLGLMQIKLKPPGSSEMIQMPVDWSWPQFAIAAGFAMLAAVLAALLPARKGAKIQPVDVLRGSS